MTYHAGVAATAGAGRFFYLDVARIVAICFVVAIHNWSLLEVLDYGTPSWWAVDIILTSSRWAVPLFVMISGAFLLRRTPPEPASVFYRKRLTRVAIPAAFWIVAYLVFRVTFLGQDLTAQEAATDVALGRPFVHLYFVYVIVGLYLLTPAIAPFVVGAGRRTLVLVSAVVVGILAIDAALPYLVGRGTIVTGLTYWVPFLGYYLAGAALFGLRLSTLQRWGIVAMIAVAQVAQILFVYWLGPPGDGSWMGYPPAHVSVFTLIVTMGIFVLCAQDTDGQARGGRTAAIVTTLAAATFGVFLVHEMVLYWYAENFVEGPLDALVGNRLPAYLVGIVGSFAIVLVARRIPIVRRVF